MKRGHSYNIRGGERVTIQVKKLLTSARIVLANTSLLSSIKISNRAKRILTSHKLAVPHHRIMSTLTG